jgi:phenylalanyl-tRNA synthetase beta chain
MISGIVTGTRQPEHWDGQDVATDFYDLKQDVQALLQFSGHAATLEFVRGEHPALHPGQAACIRLDDRAIGWIGRIHPQLANACDLEPGACMFEIEYDTLSRGRLASFKSISRFPSIRRDLAVVVDDKLQAAQLEIAIRDAAGSLLQELIIFDVYQGKGVESGRKSMAFGLILQDNSRTLAEQDIEAVVSRVTARLNEEFGASLRD